MADDEMVMGEGVGLADEGPSHSDFITFLLVLAALCHIVGIYLISKELHDVYKVNFGGLWS